jgi:hypothetical protein
MHESEWLPQLFSKSDLLQICNLFNLSVAGFRKDRLSSRPEEQLRTVVAEALKKGIGEKKAAKGKIPIQIFYYQISENLEVRKIDDFEEWIIETDMNDHLRPFQKISLLFEWFNDKYIEQIETIKNNVIEKREPFYGMSLVTDSFYVDRTIKQLKSETNYPAHNEYLDYIEKCGANELFLRIKAELSIKENDRAKFSLIMGLSPFERFLAIVHLLPQYAELEGVAFSLFLKEKEKQSMETLFHVKCEFKEASELTEKLTIELEEEKVEKIRLNEELELLTDELTKIVSQAETYEKKIRVLSKERDNEIKTRTDLETIKDLFNEMVPLTNEALIITDKPDPRIKKVFLKLIYSKNFLLKEKQSGNIKKYKDKVWFIDRQSFNNMKEWILLRNYFIENGFYYEEYNDYLELLKQYMKVIHNDYTEAFEK